jgi:hypothetical protein
MMRKLFCLIVILFTTANLFAQTKTETYAAAVRFNSKCCGVPDAKPLFDEIITFKKANKIKSISYDNIGPLGKEGEYMIGFNLKELSKKQKALFVTLLKKVVPMLKTPGKDEASSGIADLKLNENKIDAKELGRATLTIIKI